MYKLIYHPDVKKIDLSKIDNQYKAMIKRAIEERLSAQPEVYGKPLQRTLKGYWKLRVGDFRVVFKIIGGEILILAVMHRKKEFIQFLFNVQGSLSEVDTQIIICKELGYVSNKDNNTI